MEEVFAEEAEKVAGRKHGHQKDRSCYHWGKTETEFPFAGRKVLLARPRVRSREGREVTLPLVEELRRLDPIEDRVIEQILLGVSTRGYDSSLSVLPVGSRGASKSAASRHVVAGTRRKVEEFFLRRLEEKDILALMLDGVKVAEHSVVVALGIAADGSKHPLGIWQGSTENAAVCTALLQDLIERGLKIDGKILCVIDGGKGLKRAIGDVLGSSALIQRCQVHKMRNLKDHLPEKRHAYVLKVMREAYGAGSASSARKKLLALAT